MQAPVTRVRGLSLARLPFISITFLIPEIGPRRPSVLSTTGRLTMAMIVSRLGVQETPKGPITLKKVVGACPLLCGVILSVG